MSPSRYDIVGWDEISGDTLVSGNDPEDVVDTILGAAASKANNPAVRQALMQRSVQRGTLVKDKPPKAGRRLVLGFDSGAVLILAGAAANLNIVPQWPFRVERLVIDPACAPNFLLNNVRVGTLSQFAAGTPVPASIFVPGAVDCQLMGDTCQTGLGFIIDYTNISLAPSRFMGAVIGTVIQF